MRKIGLVATLVLFSAAFAHADVSITDASSMRAVWKAENLAKKQAKALRHGKPGLSSSSEATGSFQLVDAAGLKYFFNTNITFSTSSSASAAASEASYTAAVAASTTAGGTTSSTLSDMFDGYQGLCVSFDGSTGPCATGNASYTLYEKNGVPLGTELSGRQMIFPVQAMGTLNVQRKVYVPSTDTYARWMDIFTNTGGSPITFNAITSNNLGSDSNTIITGSSSGDMIATTADTWVSTFQNYSGNVSSDPRIGHIVGTTQGIFFANGDDNPFWSYTITLNPGQTAIVLNYSTGQPSKTASMTKAAALAAAPPTDGMTATEISEVVNFALGAGANPAAGPNTIDNYDNCDVTVSPAATLLLPYFEVDLANPAGRDTLFTMTNVSDVPAVAHVTVWSNWSFPVLDFNIFLTGYDVEGVSMRDVILNGNLPSTGIPSTISPRGSRSLGNTVNPHKGGTWDSDCNGNLGGPAAIPSFLRSAIRTGLTGGAYLDCDQIGDDVAGDGTLAVGYVTIDVANTCSQSLPIDPAYFDGEILYDNQLIGDYIRIDGSNNYAGGSPLVHIKAVPPGGLAGGTPPAIGFPRTFYSRYQSLGGGAFDVLDRRQPLPALFAARYVDGGASSFGTNMVIWREGVTTNEDTDCDNIALNSALPFVETVRFDTKENPSVRATTTCPVSPCPQPPGVTLTETQSISIGNTDVFPADPGTGDIAGWLYLNMTNPKNPYGAGVATQNWVIVSMSAAGRFAVDYDAAWMSNGCTGFVGVTEGTPTTGITGNKIGPKYSNADPTLNWP